ncbi:MAG: hypothetical protein K8L99_07505 [Anaerolineae bacterium]|nr:hypothetical protein [Anaerolineae bacterium]
MRALWLSLLVFMVVACEPEPTPFPVDMPSEEITQLPATQEQPVAIRYALAANTENHVSDLNLIAAKAEITQLEDTFSAADLGTRFDVIAAYGNWPGAILSPVTPTVSLVINTSVAPFTDESIIPILEASVDPASVLEALAIPVERSASGGSSPADLRVQLANAGWPDGFERALGHSNPPGVDEIVQQWAAIHITAYPQLMTQAEVNPYDLLLVQWSSPDERELWSTIFGATTRVVDLYSLPISYWAVPEVNIEFTPGGWPVPS